MNLKAWISAFRLRTLPLATAGIVLASFLAAAEQSFQWQVAALALLTAVLLQVLSNLANDYGDSIHGADTETRIGPRRATASGSISARAMRNAILMLVTLCLVSGYMLIRNESIYFHLAGLAAIAAAVAYTVGPRPYGYVGLGDLFVFFFFGLVAVCGAYYLHTHTLNYGVLLPAASCGFFSVAVLNINNIRDMQSDQQAGKITLAIRLGPERVRLYHWSLLLAGVICAALFILIQFHSYWQWLFLLTLPLFWMNGLGVARKSAAQLDPYLRQMAISTLLFALSFGLGGLL